MEDDKVKNIEAIIYGGLSENRIKLKQFMQKFSITLMHDLNVLEMNLGV